MEQPISLLEVGSGIVHVSRTGVEDASQTVGVRIDVVNGDPRGEAFVAGIQSLRPRQIGQEAELFNAQNGVHEVAPASCPFVCASVT